MLGTSLPGLNQYYAMYKVFFSRIHATPKPPHTDLEVDAYVLNTERDTNEEINE